jgi:hypothetical protein
MAIPDSNMEIEGFERVGDAREIKKYYLPKL